MTRFEPVGEIRCELGEGPVWVPDFGELWWVDLAKGMWFRRNWRTGQTDVHSFGERVSIVLPTQGGGACVALGKEWVYADGPDMHPLATVERDIDDTFINDARSGPDSRVYFGTFDRRRRPGVCGLYRLDGEGSTRIADDVVISNGLDWSPSGKLLYVVDSHRQQIVVFDFDVVRGSVERRRVFVEIPPDKGMPDGMAVDCDGDLWVALYGGGAIHRYDPNGRLRETIKTPVEFPTSCCFAAPPMNVLVVTSGFSRILAAGEQPSDLDGAVVACDVDAVGLPIRPAALFSPSC
jgi:sugar lactone lactonase YvrE